MTNYPTQLDEIDQWLFDSFGIVAGACSSTENLRYNTAKMVAEALLKRDQVEGPSRDQVDKLEKAAQEYIKKGKYPPEAFVVKPAFIAGANWQKEQLRDLCYQCEKNYDNVFFKGEQNAIKRMEKENKETIEIAEEHAMLAGMVKQEEEMKEKALEVTVYPDDDGYPCIPEIVLFDFDKNQPTAKEGDRIKVYLFRDNKE